MKPSCEDQHRYHLLIQNFTNLQYAYGENEANRKVMSTGFGYRQDDERYEQRDCANHAGNI